MNSPSNTYITATIFSLAHPYGTPSVLSSYSFSTTDDGAPNGGKFKMDDVSLIIINALWQALAPVQVTLAPEDGTVNTALFPLLA